MDISKETSKRYYDPEAISLLLTAISALGSIAAFVDVAMVIAQDRNSRKEQMATIEERLQHKYSIREEMRYTLHSLSCSVDSINYELVSFENIYHISKKVNDDSIMRFGNGSMWLERYQFEKFYQTQTRIIDEVHNINSNLKLMEELLLAGEDDSLVSDLGYNIRARHMLRDETEPINRLISQFGEISIREFIAESIEICHHVRNIIWHLEENLRRNYR